LRLGASNILVTLKKGVLQDCFVDMHLHCDVTKKVPWL